MTRRSFGKIIKTLLAAALILAIIPTTAFADGETASSVTQLQSEIAQNMTNRETLFAINYTGDASQLQNISNVVNQAAQSSDYLDLSWSKINYNITPNTGGSNGASVNLTIQYYTTKAQEEYVDQKVDQLVPTIINSGMTDFQKEKAIHDWIINHVSYDSTLQQRTAYTALTSGKTVCAGYAMLMEKMLTKAGIKCIIVTGSIPEGSHAWNMVQIDGNWYQVDATNDAGFANTYRRYNKTNDFLIQHNYVWDQSAYPTADTTYQAS